MEKLLAFFRKLNQRFQELSQVQKVAVLVLAAAGVASMLVMSLWLRAPDHQLLYANLTSEDAAAIVEHLKNQKVSYELSNNGRTIRVPADRLHDIRLNLASEGLPEGGEVGLEIFEESNLGMTDFIQKLNYQRALQGELVRTIKTLEAVDQARVHLVIPKDTLFLKEKPRGKASVMLKIKPGKTLTKSQAQGIVHLVSASVEGIAAQDVVVVDLEGNLLSGGQEGTTEALLTASHFEFKQRVEKKFQDNIVKMLEDALGEGKVIARVNADLDFEKVERTEEIYDPDSQVVRSEQIVTESTTGAAPPGGVPGAQGLVPNPEAAGAAAGQPAQREKENQTFNYEINKVVRQISKPTGSIKKLSAAVLIDGTRGGEPPEYQPRSAEEMAKYTEIVKSALGYNEQRGDQIRVENIQFDRSFLLEEQARMEQAEMMDLGFQIAKYVLGAIFILLFFTRVIRPIINWMTTSLEVVPDTAAQLTAADLEAVEEEKKRLSQTGQEAADVRQAVADFVASDPKFTAGLVRKWMRDKGAPS